MDTWHLVSELELRFKRRDHFTIFLFYKKNRSVLVWSSDIIANCIYFDKYVSKSGLLDYLMENCLFFKECSFDATKKEIDNENIGLEIFNKISTHLNMMRELYYDRRLETNFLI